MMRLWFLSSFVVIACGAKSGAVGPAGAAGAQGPQGDPGAAGVCDLSSCPPPFEGGSVQNATNFQGDVTFARVVVTKGSQSTSTNAFYCGATSFKVGGDASKAGASGASADIIGPWIANKYCQDTCASPTAHVCTSSEFIKFQSLRAWTDGGDVESSDSGSNHGVPMPLASPAPADSDFDRGWIYAADGVSSCQGFSNTTAGVNGVVFRPGSYGSFLPEACSATHPLYCCD